MGSESKTITTDSIISNIIAGKEPHEKLVDIGSENSSPNRKSPIGLILTGLIGSSALILSVISIPFLTPALRKVRFYTEEYYYEI